jgi:hypothetical protein
MLIVPTKNIKNTMLVKILNTIDFLIIDEHSSVNPCGDKSTKKPYTIENS